MMSSGSSTEPGRASGDSGLQPWHFYFILAMGGATWAVTASRHTHPAALLLLSAAILATGLAAVAVHHALAGFWGGAGLESTPLTDHLRADLEREKALVLRSIKELEFDRAMGKVSEADFADMSTRLRTRAMVLIEQLAEGRHAAPAAVPAAAPVEAPHPARATAGLCASCDTQNDGDARFCKQCGARLS